tara:strand:- start:1610 stop:2482 length:873 start_codon:yes stop_codon:yes gene_type:complete
MFKIKNILLEKIIKILKLILKKSIFLIKSVFLLDNLTPFEVNGNMDFLTRIKFLKKTQLKVPFSLGRSARGISFNDYLINDPIYKIIYEASQYKNVMEIIDSFFVILKNENNLSAADIVGLKNNERLKQYPAWCYVLPWENTDINFKLNNYESIQKVKREQKALEYNFKNRTVKDNYIYSKEMAESQVLQSIKLFESIKRFGLLPQFDLPSFHILVKGNKWKWYMSQGNHRAYILYNLKYKFIGGIVDSVIIKEKSHLWPNVLNGLYSVKEAEIIFDYLFDAERSIGPCI